MLIVPDENKDAGSSVASSLHVFKLMGENLFDEFCDALATNASRIRLPCFDFGDITMVNEEWESLTMCLPKLVYLKELIIPGHYQTYGSRRHFVDALRTNGSLQRVTWGDDEDVFDEAELRLIRTTCERNEAIPTLVATTSIGLLPKLLGAAKEAPKTAPTAILIALLAAGDSIGPRRQYGKRSHPDESIERVD